MLWEALAGQHPFWGVPLPQVAAAIEAGAKPIATDAARPRRRRSPTPSRRRSRSSPRSGRPPSDSQRRSALRSRLRGRRARGRPKPPAPKAVGERGQASPARAPARAGRACGRHRHLRRRAAPLLDAGPRARCSRSPRRSQRCGRPASASRSPSSCLCSRSETSPRRPRSPTRSLAIAWLAVCWRDARAGLLFVAGPLLASDRRARPASPRRAAGPRTLRAGLCTPAWACSPPPPSRGFAARRCRSPERSSRTSASTARPASPTSSQALSVVARRQHRTRSARPRARPRGGVPARRPPARLEGDRASSASRRSRSSPSWRRRCHCCPSCSARSRSARVLAAVSMRSARYP